VFAFPRLAQIAVASMHLEGVRPQYAAFAIFTASTILVIGLVAAHERPFQPPLGVSSGRIANLLDAIPDS
jgi:hypothetical protein